MHKSGLVSCKIKVSITCFLVSVFLLTCAHPSQAETSFFPPSSPYTGKACGEYGNTVVTWDGSTNTQCLPTSAFLAQAFAEAGCTEGQALTVEDNKLKCISAGGQK